MKFEEILGLVKTQPELATNAEKVQNMATELWNGFEVLKDIQPAISCFGSARTPAGHPDYQLAEETHKLLAEKGWGTISGGGPGIMEAANKGAFEAGALSVGLNINLPFEQTPNQYQTVSLDFNYFFARKVFYVQAGQGLIVYPGGFGTADELFEILTLRQTTKITDRPVVLAAHDNFWEGLVEWMEKHMLSQKLIVPQDLERLKIAHTPEEIWDHLEITSIK